METLTLREMVDKDLVQFIQDAALVDEYHNRYPEQINTYLWGHTKRLDYILMDASAVELDRIFGNS